MEIRHEFQGLARIGFEPRDKSKSEIGKAETSKSNAEN
jgi:hypothetical protein